MLGDLGVLLAQCAAFRVGLLAIAHPLRSLRLELALDQLEHRAHVLQLEGRHFLPLGKSLVWANRAQAANLSPGGAGSSDSLNSNCSSRIAATCG